MQDTPAADAAAHSPGVACASRGPPIDTVRAVGKGGSHGYWPHTPRAGSRQLLDAAPGGEAHGLLGTGGFRRAGEGSQRR